MGSESWLGRMGWSPSDVLALGVSVACLLGCAAWTCGTTSWGSGAAPGGGLGMGGRLFRALIWEAVFIGFLVVAIWRIAILSGPGPFQRNLLPIVLVAGGLGAVVRVWALPPWLGYPAESVSAGWLRQFLVTGLVGAAPCLGALLVIFSLGGELPVFGAPPAAGSPPNEGTALDPGPPPPPNR